VFPKLDRPQSMLDIDDYSPRASEQPSAVDEDEKPDSMVS